MKSLLKLFTVLSISALAISCGRSSNSAKVKPVSTTVTGDLSEYLQIVDNEYEIVDDWGGKISVKVKALQPYTEDKDVQLQASLLDEDGTPVSGSGEFEVDYSSKDKLISLLKRGSGEEVIQLRALLDGYKAEQHADKVKKFTVSSLTSEKTEVASTADEESTSETNESSSEDFDELLDSYEKYADDYISMIQSMSNNDMGSALENYGDALTSAQEMEEKLKNLKNRLTAKQASRMLKIQAKMIKAMEKMDDPN